MSVIVPSVLVRYRDIGGFHTFDCEEIPNFHVTNTDLMTAFLDVPEELSKAMGEYTDKTTLCSCALTWEEFLEDGGDLFEFNFEYD